jgi:predicted extracellular nuclease
MYLYGDYKYNDVMIQAESRTRATGIRIFGEKDPGYDYEKVLVERTTESVRSEELGKRVRVEGVVTARIGNNAFIQKNGYGIYVYAAQKRWQHLVAGNEVAVTGTLSEYNSLLEISNIEEIALVAEKRSVDPTDITLRDIGERNEGTVVRIRDVTIEGVEPHSGRGYNVSITQNGYRGIIRIDQYLIPYIEPESFEPGSVVDIVAPVGQYQDDYQLMLPSLDNVTEVRQ